MFLHGWGADQRVFAPAFSFLKDHTVTTVDLYGFGETPAPTIPVDLDYYVQGVKRLMAYYNMENVLVVGHSFGGRVAVKLAQSSRVAGVVLVDAAGLRPRRKPSYYWKVGVYKIGKKLKLPVKGGSADYRALVGAMKGTFVRVVREDLSAPSKKIPCPVLLIWGEKDKDTPLYMYKKYLRIIPNVRGAVIKNAGHFSFADAPKRFYTLIRQFSLDVLQ